MMIVLAERLVTCDPARATPEDPLGVIENGFVTIERGVIRAVGHATELGEAPVSAELMRAGLVTPGLIDAHTHAAWFGSRHEEYALRMAGADYEQIAAAGGGILSSMRAVRAASVEDIAASLERRLARMASLGVTTVEVKSGYGLDRASEEKQLRAIASAAKNARAPNVVPTYLALHALPPEAPDRSVYAQRVAAEDLSALAKLDLFRFVDAYIERSAFSVEQTRPLVERARALGLGVRLHIGQFADVGGGALAAAVGARSVDHVEHVCEADRIALAAAGTRAVLLPTASFTLGQPPPDVAALRAAGVRLVVASDANPGTAPTESLPLALALAVRTYGLSVAETILGATREAAICLDLPDAGVLVKGARADVVAWDLPHEAALVQPFGVSRARVVLRRGEIIHNAG